MKKNRRTVLLDYVSPCIKVAKMESEGYLLAGSPPVRPGGGGTGSNKGRVNVIDGVEEDGGDNDILEG